MGSRGAKEGEGEGQGEGRRPLLLWAFCQDPQLCQGQEEETEREGCCKGKECTCSRKIDIESFFLFHYQAIILKSNKEI